MVSQGVKNPLIDLTALEDKTLDEVSTWGSKTETKNPKENHTLPLVTFKWIFLLKPQQILILKTNPLLGSGSCWYSALLLLCV